MSEHKKLFGIICFFVIAALVLSFWGFTQQRQLPSFNSIASFKERQAAFIGFMLPLAHQVNREVLAERHQIQMIQASYRQHGHLSRGDTDKLRYVAQAYRVPLAPEQSKFWAELYQRVNQVPYSLLLAQAINESAWGTSRFAREGYNLFGQWCYQKGCGLVPRKRGVGMTHEVKVFASPYKSVRAYVANLNRNKQYAYFRQLRSQLTQQHKAQDGYALAAGLSGYSQKGQHYVEILRGIMVKYHLAQYDR